MERYDNIITIKRDRDGEIFSVGDKIVVDNPNAHIEFTLSEIIIYNIGNKSFVCVKTEEKNGFGDGLINLDIIKLVRPTNCLLLQKKCLSIQDYIDVLEENNKSFLFLPTMIKHLKEKINEKEI